MRQFRQRYPQPAAFTLLEVMLAVTILSIIVVSIFATFNAGLAGWKRSAGVSENFQRERIVIGTLNDLTKSLVFAPSPNTTYSVNYEGDSQNGSSVSFVTASTMLLPPSEASVAGMRRVTIGLQRDEYGRSFLGLSNASALAADNAPNPIMHVLSADVCGFSVRFRDPKDGNWKDTWDDSTLMPSAMEYTVGFGKNDGRTPPVVVTQSIELPTAAYIMQVLGQATDQNDTTNSVNKQNLNLSPGGATGNSGGSTGQ